MPDWTEQQSNAITARNSNILVSAAAGSGKTAVLVERVVKMITDSENPVDIDNLLIVTFTNDAAAEMRSRINKSLNSILNTNPNDRNIRKQLSFLPNAKICTIDSFCINLVRDNFYTLSINQDFKTFDESELQLLEDGVIGEVISDYFENNDKEFISLIELFTTPNNDKAITSVIKKILRFIYAQPFPYKWANEMIELYNPEIPFEESVWFDYIKTEISYLFDFCIDLVNDMLSTLNNYSYDDDSVDYLSKYLDLINEDLMIIEKQRKIFESSWDEFCSCEAPAFSRLPSSKKIKKNLSEKVKACRNIYKDIITNDIPSFLVSNTEEYTDDMKALYPSLKKLLEVVKSVDSRLMEEKKEGNAYSFSDLEHFAIDLLFRLDNGEIKKTELADSLSDSFYEILVDEYQDTNEAQDMLFRYLSNGKNLFTVGDIKQSIYRFRLAMPNIFNEKRRTYSPYSKESYAQNAKIILDRNFRNRQDICSYVNFIFSNLMTERVGEINYDKKEFLVCGAKYNDTETISSQIKILTGVKGEDTSKKEAEYIAKTILDKVKSKELIKDGDNYRPINYGDFAILMRSLKNTVNDYSEVLTSYGIPVICDNSVNLFDNAEIKMIVSFLRVIDNPTLNIPLLATMLSPIYGFSADEIAELRIENRKKGFDYSVLNSENARVKEFLNDISRLKKLSVTMSVSSFIRYIVEEKGIVAFANAMGNGEQRYQNILKLISFAQSFDSGVNVGLTAFLRYIDKIISSDKSVESASLTTTGEGAVTIMSIHHSKGLEFPVCILAGASRQYNKSDLYDKLLLNTKLGFGLKRHNEELLYQYQTIPYSVIKNKSTVELMSENLRVLYVALTRAKEQFITFITCDSFSSKIKRLAGYITDGQINPYVCKRITCDGDFLLLCALIHQDGISLRNFAECDVKYFDTDFNLDIEITDEIKLEEKETVTQDIPADQRIIDKIAGRLEYSYKRSELSALSSKLTASSLDEADRGFEYLTSSKPAFLNDKKMTASQKGTAMHTFMQFCSYENARDSLEGEIDRLQKNGFITQEQADCLDKSKLSKFFDSKFAKRMFDSDNIYREIKISSFVKASELYDTKYDDKVLIQGIADCVFEESGELVLVDYKTDKVENENELLDRYKKQISFYRLAVSKTLEKPVKEAVLYSFHLGKECYYK